MFGRFVRRVMSRISYGWSLGIRSARIVLNDKTLMLFPLTSMAVALFAIWIIYIGVGPDKWHLVLNTEVNDRGVQLVNYGYYLVVFLAYLGLAILTVFCNVGLVGCTHISMTERDSKYRDGFNIALRNIPSIIIWAIISSTFGVLISILDREKHISAFLRRILGTSWSILAYFVLPVVVLEKRFVFTAFPRSVNIMTETWGEDLEAQFSLRWFLFLLSLPLVGLYLMGYYIAPHWDSLLLAIGLGYFALIVVLAQTVKTVLTVVLYKYATSGEAPEGWSESLLKDSFLRLDTPEQEASAETTE